MSNIIAFVLGLKSAYKGKHSILGFLIFILKLRVQAGGWWLMPVILATQEAEIRRIVVRSIPGQRVPLDPISKKPFTKKI
jgi:hypothetical protein